ncbi:MAG: hypothetical protein HC898_01195 [Phycisphaerales bacterium]|nr:hypothetical protein [Phycisphaerales bacterium]
MPRDNKPWRLGIDDASKAQVANESELAKLLASAASKAGIGFESHFELLPDSSKVIGMTAKHFQQLIETGVIQLASQKTKTLNNMAYSDEDKKYQTYYVHSTLGDDRNSGDSPDKPLKSFYKGVAKLKINDTLIVGPGKYHIDLKNDQRMVENLVNCWIVASPHGQAVITCAWKEAYDGSIAWKHEIKGSIQRLIQRLLVMPGILNVMEKSPTCKNINMKTSCRENIPIRNLRTCTLSCHPTDMPLIKTISVFIYDCLVIWTPMDSRL